MKAADGWVAALERLIAADLRVTIALTTEGATVSVAKKGGAGGDSVFLTERAAGPAAACLPRAFRRVMHAPEIVGFFAR